MATVEKWTPFGVALDITATAGTVTRTSATQYTVIINASWETYYNGAKTNYGMTASSGGNSATINAFGTNASSGSGSFTGTYSISGNGSATKTVTVTFRNFNSDNGNSATKNVSLSVTVPALTSYTVKYNANGGSGAPGSQTKWKDQALTLSSTKPTRTGYSFLGWAASSTATSPNYSAGANYGPNASITLYAVWQANTYTVTYNANGGSDAPENQTKTYGKVLTLSSAKPTRANYNFKGWGTSASATTVSYTSGGSYSANAPITLYAIWELAYTKPRINNISVGRCGPALIDDPNGNYAAISFDWACDKAVTGISVSWLPASGTGTQTISASGTSGSVYTIIGAGAFDSQTTYTLSITVADGAGDAYQTTIKRTLPSRVFLIQGMPENKGIAFGKAAELEGYADFGFKIYSNFGELITTPLTVEENADLNDLTTPGFYVVPDTAISATITNKPPFLGDTDTSTAIIEVGRMGNGQQVYQRYSYCSKPAQITAQRLYYSGTWGEWVIIGGYTAWKSLPFASGFTKHSSDSSGANSPKYRVNGNIVSVCGVASPSADMVSSTTETVFASGIPEHFRPATKQFYLCQGSNANKWLLSINTNGELCVSRYGTTTTSATMTANTWLVFSVSYSI